MSCPSEAEFGKIRPLGAASAGAAGRPGYFLSDIEIILHHLYPAAMLLIGALAFHSRYLNENVTSHNIASSSLCDVMPKSKYALDEQSGARRCSNLILSGVRR
jgi:hypothetical protein